MKNEIEKYLDFIFTVALSKCHDNTDAEDLTQETLLTALSELKKGTIVVNMKPWLTGILLNIFNGWLRKKYKLPVVTYDIECFAVKKDPTARLIKAEEAEKIRREVAYLAKIHREVITLYYMDGKSVEKIAKELHISVGTVKSRLFGGRQKIGERIQTMENYTKLSYQPSRLYLSNSGSSGLRGEPHSVINGDLIRENILLITYEKPLTEEEIARAIGIPTAYIEQIVERLIEGELMRRTRSKVYTDFIIFDWHDYADVEQKQKEYIEKNMGVFWKYIERTIKEIQKMDYYKKHGERARKKLEFFIVLYTIQFSIFKMEKPVTGSLDSPVRKNGGRWAAFGNKKPTNLEEIPSELDEVEKYMMSGHRSSWYRDFAQFYEYDTTLDHLHYYTAMKQPMGSSEVAMLLYVIEKNIEPNSINFATRYMENIPELIERGLLIRDGEKLKVDLPVLTQEEYTAFIGVCSSGIDEIEKELGEDFLVYMKTTKKKIPNHLKDVPEWLRYHVATSNIPMRMVFSFKEKGLIFKDIEYICPAKIFVITK